MSDALSALQGASSKGFVTVSDAGLRGMITIRGDLGGAKLRSAVKRLVGLGLPGQGAIQFKGERGVAWMSPDELLILGPYDSAAADAQSLQDALAGTHHLVANVSDARAVIRLQGASLREVLAKLCPADVSPGAFGQGQIRRSRLAQAAAAFWLTDEATAEVVCFRSVAAYVYGLLENAARPGGEVGHFPA